MNGNLEQFCYFFCVPSQDSASGVKAGVAAGMPVVAIASRNPEKLLKAAGATLVVTDFEDTNLWGALKELDRNLGC